METVERNESGLDVMLSCTECGGTKMDTVICACCHTKIVLGLGAKLRELAVTIATLNSVIQQIVEGAEKTSSDGIPK